MRNLEQENAQLKEENERLNMTLIIIEKAILLEKKKQAQQTQAL